MKTLLSQFCEEFEAVVRPLLTPLKDFTEVLADLSERGGSTAGAGAGTAPQADPLGGPLPGGSLREVVPGFQDVNHQLRVLAEKVAEQQAYVLIFGPLKSGKSTLMNAIGAAYVSEVTALPAYPCMVYVSHAENREFLVTRYNGDQQSFAAPASMRMQVNRDHTELADRIRSEETRGTDFDPSLHFPEAIRRIDVRVPAADLAESGAVLVDTPGLYSRMKFGYDQMTREFRDTAACAIFVVKTDNLFLEQVFAEFQELLSLFSRIFLVVNVDTNKMDLRPDGSLAPSLEREDPVRVIEAFETLAMSAELKDAVEEGRLKIYPVDLLRAASSRLTQQLDGGQGDETDYVGRADFGAFRGDLTDYLNSTDYLVAFLGDSLRHGTSLVRRGRDLAGHSVVESIARRATELAAERDELADRVAAFERLDAYDWNEAFEPLAGQLSASADGEGGRLWKSSLRSVSNAIDGWFEGDDSIADLLARDVGEVVAGFQANFASLAEAELKVRAQNGTAGALLDERVARDLESVGIRLDDFAGSGLVAVVPKAFAHGLEVDVDLDGLPVRKSLLDWILFRSVATVRRRLIGSGARPERPIGRREKARRMGEAGRDWLHDAVHGEVDDAYSSVADEVARGMAREYADAVVAAVRTQLASVRAGTAERLEQLGGQLAELEELADRLTVLRTRLDEAGEGMEALQQRYAEADPSELNAVVEPSAVAPEMGESPSAEPVVELHPTAPPVEAADDEVVVEDSVEASANGLELEGEESRGEPR